MEDFPIDSSNPSSTAGARDGKSRSSRQCQQVLYRGAASLSDDELLSLLLGWPSRAREGESIASGQALDGLVGKTPAELSRLPGFGPRRIARLLATVELGARIARNRWRAGRPFTDARQVHEHVIGSLRGEGREVFLVLLLDARHRLLREEVVSVGSLVASIVHPREVFRPAVRHGAGAMVVVHNHPSGDPEPSEEDIAVTERLHRCGRMLGIEVLDHVVVGAGGWCSLRDEGLGPFRIG